MASSSAHDFFFQEANTISFVHSLISRAWRHLGVTHVPLVIQALLAMCWLKKVDFDLHIVCFSWLLGCEGSGAIFVVCACAVGLRGNGLTGMRGTWGVVWRSAHVPTIPFTWLRRANALGPTAHASNHHVNNVDLTLVCVCSWSHGVTWFFMPKYGHCDVKSVTWPKCSILIGRENFCCDLIGRDPKGPLSLLTCYVHELSLVERVLSHFLLDPGPMNVTINRQINGFVT